uniref:Uncharacterized protein n=1 Tax=Opuntia streptacantha TaxID=393608 RepID=A0A7C9AT56_OPUST
MPPTNLTFMCKSLAGIMNHDHSVPIECTYPATSVKGYPNIAASKRDKSINIINVSISPPGKHGASSREPKSITFDLDPVLDSLLNTKLLVRTMPLSVLQHGPIELPPPWGMLTRRVLAIVHGTRRKLIFHRLSSVHL